MTMVMVMKMMMVCGGGKDNGDEDGMYVVVLRAMVMKIMMAW